jgi:hypothetical protein
LKQASGAESRQSGEVQRAELAGPPEPAITTSPAARAGAWLRLAFVESHRLRGCGQYLGSWMRRRLSSRVPSEPQRSASCSQDAGAGRPAERGGGPRAGRSRHSGTLSQHSWEKNGEKVYGVTLACERIERLCKAPNRQDASEERASGRRQDEDSDIPF